jgi:hypothetical protein
MQNETKPASGLTNVVNTIVSPKEAFEALREAPTWGWALIIGAILSIIGYFLALPASHHATLVAMQSLTSGPSFSTMSDVQKQQMLASANPGAVRDVLGAIGPVIFLLIAVLLNTLFMLIANAIGKGQADFKRLWCGSMNIAVPTFALGQLVAGIIAVLRGPDSFTSMADLFRAVPGLGTLASGMHGFGGAFLAFITVFSLWGLFLNGTMMRAMARAAAGASWAVAILVTILGAAIGGLMGLVPFFGF